MQEKKTQYVEILWNLQFEINRLLLKGLDGIQQQHD